MARKTSVVKEHKPLTPTVKKTHTVIEKPDLLGTLDAYFDKRMGWIIWVILGLTFVFSLLLFDSRVSLSGDDSFYIIRASDFIHSFKYPAFQGSLYPIVLSVFVAVFGINLIPLKVLSLLSIMGFMYLFFISFKSRIPSTLLVITLLALSINSFLLYYSSQTYNEAFYMLVMMFVVWVFFTKFSDVDTSPDFKTDIKRHLWLAISLLALTLTKNMGYSAVIAVVAYFTLKGQWRNLLFSVASFAVVFVLFQGVKYLLWSDGDLQFASQGSGLMNKDYYNPQAGKEDLAGFYTRFVDNSNLYLSKHFISAIGFRKAVTVMTVNSAVTVLLYLLSVASLLLTYRKNRYLFFTGLLTGSFLLVTFVVLQTKWDQSRLIIPAVPFLILILLSVFYYASKLPKLKIIQILVPLLGGLVLFQSLLVTASAVKQNQEISGRYGGLTPDWKNYLKASEWAAANLPSDAVIACRKPSISFVYGQGRNFYGIMQLPTYSNEVFFENWQKNIGQYMLFNYADFNNKPLPQDLYMKLKSNLDAMIFLNDSVYFVEKVADSVRESMQAGASTAGLSFVSTVDEFRTTVGETKTMKLYYPDSLLLQLQNAGVTHIITASIRRNSAKKDGLIVNTVERYMAFIQEKYPKIFTRISQVGDENNEPATVVKIEYEAYGLKPKKTEKE